MKYIFCEKRNETMKKWLGKACDLIDDEQWLGVFRNRQINYKKEFDQSVKMVKSMKKAGKIKNAKHYFAKIWKKENIERTLKIVREFLNRQVSKLANQREQARRNYEYEKIAQSRNEAGLKRLDILKREYNLS